MWPFTGTCTLRSFYYYGRPGNKLLSGRVVEKWSDVKKRKMFVQIKRGVIFNGLLIYR